MPYRRPLSVKVLGHLNSPIVEFEMDQELVDVSGPSRTVKSNWAFRDAQGHMHDAETWRVSTVQPTKTVWCQECHDDHEESDGPRRCKWCRDVVEPHFITESYGQVIPGTATYTAVSMVDLAPGTLVVAYDMVLEVIDATPVSAFHEAARYHIVLNPVGRRYHTVPDPFATGGPNG